MASSNTRSLGDWPAVAAGSHQHQGARIAVGDEAASDIQRPAAVLDGQPCGFDQRLAIAIRQIQYQPSLACRSAVDQAGEQPAADAQGLRSARREQAWNF